jgi:hypothetical protein
MDVILSGESPVYETANLQDASLLYAQHAVSHDGRQLCTNEPVWGLGGETARRPNYVVGVTHP